MYHWRATLGPVDLAFTDRFGGVSHAPFEELNLALEGGDDPAATTANLDRVVADFAPGSRVAQMRQVHGAEVVLVDEPGEPGTLPEADALVTTRPDVTLVVRVADCVPVLLADPEAGVLAAVHAGRPGVRAGVVGAAVRRARELGAGELRAFVGPHVCGACYEVPEQMRQEVAAVVPETAATTSWGTPALDLGAGVRAQLRAAGVRDVQEIGECTRESAALYSYRRDGVRAGRQAGLIRWHR